MISWYGQFVVLPDEVKQRMKVKINPTIERLDCIKSAGYYKGIEPWINSKGMFKFYLKRTDEMKADGKRKADYNLQGEYSMNFSSVFPFDIQDKQFLAFGEPNNKNTVRRSKTINKKRIQVDIPNPMLPYKNDLFLFIWNNEYTKLELLIIEKGRYLTTAYCNKLLNGGFDDQLKQFRETAQEFYKY